MANFFHYPLDLIQKSGSLNKGLVGCFFFLFLLQVGPLLMDSLNKFKAGSKHIYTTVVGQSATPHFFKLVKLN